jgi:hypothetical protein
MLSQWRPKNAENTGPFNSNGAPYGSRTRLFRLKIEQNLKSIRTLGKRAASNHA